MRLTDDQVARYNDEGVLSVPGFLAPKWIDAFRTEADRLTAASTAADFDPERVEMEPNQDPAGKSIRRMYDRARIIRRSGTTPKRPRFSMRSSS